MLNNFFLTISIPNIINLHSKLNKFTVSHIVVNHVKDILNLESLKNASSQSYNSAAPFPHVIIDNFFKEEIAEEINKVFPGPDEQIWFEYNNPIEKKFASDDIRKFPSLIAQAIHALNTESFLKELTQITCIENLLSDPYLHGGGLHLIKSGGKLDMHLDYSIHPKLKLERKMNLIIYMVDKDFSEEWGGELELWKGEYDKEHDEYSLTTLEKKIFPKFNRAILFNTNDVSFHGHPNPLNTPEGVFRKSMALYYLTKPQENISIRPRARFIARPFDDKIEEVEAFRKKRSQLTGLY